MQPKLTVILAMIATACGPTGAPAPAPNENSSVQAESGIEASQLGGWFVTVEADEAKPMGKPRLVLACDGDGSPGLQLWVRDVPRSPPPLAGVFLKYRFDDRAPERQEASWATNDNWLFRNDDQAEAEFVGKFLSSRKVTLDLPPEFSDGKSITWQRRAVPASRDFLRKWCSLR